MKVGQRIQVQSKFLKGQATILYIAPGEIYPIQVEMDEPDSDGHKIYRFAPYEIANELPAENDSPASTELSTDPEQLLGEVIQEVTGYSFKNGQKFLLEKRRKDSSVYYVYEQKTNKFRGCMHVSMFKMLEAFEAEPVKKELPDPFVISEEVRYEQMSLLDFL